ncbi:MAG: hypothetical protein RLZ98_2647 [Pseudomonadota bacterium]|jgi:hypothetical protein
MKPVEVQPSLNPADKARIVYKSPVIVDADADVRKVAADLAAAKPFNGGQACICPDHADQYQA